MNYPPLMDDVRAPASPEAIAAIERHIGAALPAAYKEFLSQSDGGGFQPGGVKLAWKGDQTVVDLLFTTDPVDTYGVIDNYNVYREMRRIPRWSCPFAPDPGGDLFLLSLEADTFGRVYYWDHSFEPPEGGEAFADFPNTHELAPDFETFVRNLEDD